MLKGLSLIPYNENEIETKLFSCLSFKIQLWDFFKEVEDHFRYGQHPTFLVSKANQNTR